MQQPKKAEKALGELKAKLAAIAADKSEIEASRLDIAPDEAQRREIELNAQRHDTEQRIKQLEECVAREREAEIAKRHAAPRYQGSEVP